MLTSWRVNLDYIIGYQDTGLLIKDHQTSCSHCSSQPKNDCINLFLKRRRRRKNKTGSFWIMWWNTLTVCSGQICSKHYNWMDKLNHDFTLHISLKLGKKVWFQSRACSDDYGSWNTVRQKLKEEFTFMTVLNIPSFLLIFIQGQGFMMSHMLNTINDLILMFLSFCFA